MSKISNVNETSLIPNKLDATTIDNDKGVEINDTGFTFKKNIQTDPSYFKLTHDGFNFNDSEFVPYDRLKNLQNNIKFDSNNNIGIGLDANDTPTGSDSIAIGTSAGAIQQTYNAIAIGNHSGYSAQYHESIAIGAYAGYNYQRARAIAIGQSAGFDNQYNGIAIGRYAGQSNQNGGIAIGTASARYNQATNAVAIGWNSGNTGQSSFAISMGTNSGYYYQGQNAIAIGRSSGFSGQGVNSIYIGSSNTNNNTAQHSNTIVLNATGIPLDTTTTNSSYITPIRELNNDKMLLYNDTTKEITKIPTNEFIPSNTYQKTNYKPFPDIVRAFYEFTTENDFMYDYSGNEFNLTNIGARYSELGAYFDINNDVRYPNQFQEDMRRIQLRGAKLNQLISSIGNEFSITFDFTPLQYDSTLFQLRNNNVSQTSFTVRITDNGFLHTTIAANNSTIFSVSTVSAISLNKPHHFCFVSNGVQSRVYLDNDSIGFTSTVIKLNNYQFDALTFGCIKDRTSERYSYPYAGWIKNFMITNSSLSNTDRTSIYNGDYGYSVVILAGQSNMVGVAPIQEGIDNNYSEIENIVYQYDFNTNTIIPATNQLRHYNTSYMNTGVSQYFNNMGAWLELVNNYVKYYKKSARRKVLLIPCGLGGSSFRDDWGTGKRMLIHLTTNTNLCLGLNSLNKLDSMLWYQGESEVFLSNANFESDLYTFRTNLISGISGFTTSTPMVVTLINNKYDIDNTILGIPANEYINNTMINFANEFGYGVVKTDDLKLLTDWIHMNAESLRIIGKRWFDSLCVITKIDNRSKPIIKTLDKTEMSDLTVDKLSVKNLDVIYNKEYDIDINSYIPIGKSINITSSIQTRSCKAFYQPKTDEIWLVPIGSLLTFKYFNVKTRRLVERTDWGSIISTGIASCMYNDMLYVLDSNHRDTWVQGAIMPETVLYIIDTLNYTIEKITNFAVKTSGIGVDWVVPADSSSNTSKAVLQTVTYASMFCYNDKLYFIPYAQQDIAIFDLKTRTIDQTTFALGYVGGFFGSVYNPSNKCLYLARAYKVGAAAGWNIPYLDFNNSPPTLGSVALPTNYVGFKGGVYCHTNNSVYIPMGVTNNVENAYVLKINSSNTVSQLTFSGVAENKQFNSCLYSPDDRIILHSAGILYRIKPEDDTLDSNISITNRFIQCFDKYGVMYSFANSASNTYGVYKFPIRISNKEIFNPIFNCMR